MKTLPKHIEDYYSSDSTSILYMPEGYENHGRRGKQPYMHVVKHEAKMNNVKSVEDKLKTDKLLYSVIFLDISDLKIYYQTLFNSFKSNYLLRDDDYEGCYDWVINECIKRIFFSNGVTLSGHYRSDVYKCVHDQIGHLFEETIRTSLIKQKYGFVAGTKVKCLVCGSNLIIARTTDV